MENLDQSVVAMMKAIAKQESGNKAVLPQEKGIGGASIYQYTTGTWKGVAKKYLGDENAPLNRANENQATYKRIKEWKDSGYKPAQIASMWNAGEGEPNAYTGKFSNGNPSIGTNDYGVKYDVPNHAKKVLENFQQEMRSIKPQQPKIEPIINQSENTQPETLEQKSMGVAKNIIGGINKGIETAEGIFRPTVGALAGNVVGNVGRAIGGTMGALAGTGKELYDVAKGGKFSLGDIGQSIKSTAQATGEFGKMIGTEGGTAAPFAGLGKVPSAAMAIPALSEGIQEGDLTKTIIGGMGLLGAKYSKGNFLEPAIIPNINVGGGVTKFLSKTTDVPEEVFSQYILRKPKVEGAIKSGVGIENAVEAGKQATVSLRKKMTNDWQNSVNIIKNNYDVTDFKIPDKTKGDLLNIESEFGLDLSNYRNVDGTFKDLKVDESINLMKDINEIKYSNSPKYNIVSRLKKELKTEIIKRFGGENSDVAKLWKNYSAYYKTLDEVEKIFKPHSKTPLQSADTSYSKLKNLFKEGKAGAFQAIIDLENEIGVDILSPVIANKLNTFFPKSPIGGALFGKLGRLVDLIGFPIRSPKIARYFVKTPTKKSKPTEKGIQEISPVIFKNNNIPLLPPGRSGTPSGNINLPPMSETGRIAQSNKSSVVALPPEKTTGRNINTGQFKEVYKSTPKLPPKTTQSLYGGVAGFNVEKGEDGKMKVDYNPWAGAAGFLGMAGGIKAKGLADDLLKEASKYKNVDEFVKSQGTKLYHGTSIESAKSIEKGSPSFKNSGANEPRNGRMDIFSLTNKRETASEYGDSVLDFYIPKNIKILKLGSQEAKELEKISIDKISKNLSVDYGEKIKISKKEAIEEYYEEFTSNIAKEAKKRGYSGMSFRGSSDYNDIETEIFDKNILKNIKTKSQLTDIWNKANK